MESRFEDAFDEKQETRMAIVMALWTALALAGATAAVLASLGMA
jgi:hypothetical protein